MAYRIMKRERLSDGVLDLRAVAPGDIEAIRQWRNAQIDVLRQTSIITPEEQVAYYATHVWPQMEMAEPGQILLAIERNGTLIGYGGLVHISWPNRRGEISFLLDPVLMQDEAGYGDIFYRFLMLVQELAFVDLGFNRLTTETYAHRTFHISIMEKAGLVPEGRLVEHVIIDARPVDSLLHGILARDWRKTRCSASVLSSPAVS